MPLTGKEYAIIEILSLRKGLTLSKEVIMGHLYGGRDEPELKIVDVFICKLRRKMNALKAHPIETVWGRGYVLREPDTKTASLAPEVADLTDDPPTGYVPNITLNKHRRDRKAQSAVRILVPAT
jgi:DNA-binding winged helix-turn-helix (wHTH) protein